MDFLDQIKRDAAEAAIAILEGTIHIDGKIYRQGISLNLLYIKTLLCRLKKQKVGVPFTIRVEFDEIKFKCDVDLVPAMRFSLEDLPISTRNRIQKYNFDFGCEISTFLAIVL